MTVDGSSARDLENQHPLATRRRSAGLTQEQLGAMVGVSPRTIYSLEQGDTANPRVGLIVNLAIALSCAVEDIWPLQWTQLTTQGPSQPPRMPSSSAVAAGRPVST